MALPNLAPPTSADSNIPTCTVENNQPISSPVLNNSTIGQESSYKLLTRECDLRRALAISHQLSQRSIITYIQTSKDAAGNPISGKANLYIYKESDPASLDIAPAYLNGNIGKQSLPALDPKVVFHYDPIENWQKEYRLALQNLHLVPTELIERVRADLKKTKFRNEYYSDQVMEFAEKDKLGQNFSRIEFYLSDSQHSLAQILSSKTLQELRNVEKERSVKILVFEQNRKSSTDVSKYTPPIDPRDNPPQLNQTAISYSLGKTEQGEPIILRCANSSPTLNENCLLSFNEKKDGKTAEREFYLRGKGPNTMIAGLSIALEIDINPDALKKLSIPKLYAHAVFRDQASQALAKRDLSTLNTFLTAMEVNASAGGFKLEESFKVRAQELSLVLEPNFQEIKSMPDLNQTLRSITKPTLIMLSASDCSISKKFIAEQLLNLIRAYPNVSFYRYTSSSYQSRDSVEEEIRLTLLRKMSPPVSKNNNMMGSFPLFFLLEPVGSQPTRVKVLKSNEVADTLQSFKK